MFDKRHYVNLSLAGLVLLGALAQVLVWLRDRAFWGDELYIALNLRVLGHAQLTGPMLYSQVAPIGWLHAEKVVYDLAGGGERILRAPSLVAGILTLVLMAVVASRALGRAGALIAVALAALSPGLLYYSAELKQYVTEVAAALAILLVADLLDTTSTGRTRRRWWALAAFLAVTLICVWVSFSALLVLGGTAGAVVVYRAVTRSGRTALTIALAAVPATGLGLWLALRRLSVPLPGNQYDFFPRGFPPEGAGAGDYAAWLPRMWAAFVEWPLGWGYPWIVLLGVVGGLVALAARRRWTWCAMLIGCWLAALAAAATRQFPLEDRVAAYLLGPTLLALAAAIDGALRLARRVRPATVLAAAAAAAVLVAFAPAARASADQVAHPRYRDAGGDVVREVAGQLRPGDTVLMYVFSRPLGAWYGGRYQLPIAGHAELAPTDRCTPSSVDKALAGHRRVWYVYGAKFSGHPSDYHSRVVDHLATHGTVVATRDQPAAGGAGWVLLDLAAGPGQPAPKLPPDPRHACLQVRP